MGTRSRVDTSPVAQGCPRGLKLRVQYESHTLVNGASFQAGICAGSWVTIQGTKLANSSRTWRTSEIVNGKLPTQLDGVSVQINGKPAYVEYISPTQINVQEPSDTALGPVNVQVTNNSVTGDPVTAQLQAASPHSSFGR